jgi:cyclophilin family peptidyl-prolyl cis-trans isomerase
VRRAFALFPAVLATGLLLAGCGGEDEATPPTETAVTETSAPAAKGECRDVEAPAPRADGGQTEPRARLDREATYALVFRTSCGSFTVTLDQEQSPATTASLVELARNGFYDDTIFHRIVPGFVIQGGDPKQEGTGGPGYQTRDTPPPDAKYVEGVVAMAKTETDAPGTAGSQFFIVTGADVGLPAEYAIVGKVTQGLDVVRRIGLLGDETTQAPTQPVVIEKVTVGEQG